MAINSITNSVAAQQASTYTAAKTDYTKKKSESSTKTDTGVVYEKSSDQTSGTVTKKTDYALVNKLKADAEERTSQLRSLVEKMMTKQGVAIGTADSMWSFLAKGDFTVDEATRAQAQADIADDGYWGVDQTSDRILDFAKHFPATIRKKPIFFLTLSRRDSRKQPSPGDRIFRTSHSAPTMPLWRSSTSGRTEPRRRRLPRRRHNPNLKRDTFSYK